MVALAVGRVRRTAHMLAQNEPVTFEALARALACNIDDVKRYVIGVTHLRDELQQIMAPSEFYLRRARAAREKKVPETETQTKPEIAPPAPPTATHMRLRRHIERIRRANTLREQALARATIVAPPEVSAAPTTAQRRVATRMQRRVSETLALRELLAETHASSSLCARPVTPASTPQRLVLRSDWAM